MSFFAYRTFCTFFRNISTFHLFLDTATPKNQLASPKEFLACKTKNIEVWSNDLYLRGTNYNAVFNNPSVNEIIR